MTTMKTRLPSKAATVEKALRMSVQGVRKSKFRNVRVEHEGVVYDSKAELKRWLELKLLERAGEITKLRRQVVYPLYGSGHTKICDYIADHVFYDKRGVQIVEDVKSAPTAKLPLFRLKAKLLRDNYGYDITIHGGKNG